MLATATGPIAGEHQGCRRTCDLARSVRGRSGTPPRFAAAERPALAGDVDKYLSELGWRELCRHLVFDAPDLALRNLQPSFDAFPWQPDDKALVAWQSRQLAMVAGADAALPEFAQLPTGLIHQPWRAAPLELKGAGVELGTTYPGPIIDHRAGRERALKAYAKVRAM